MQNANTCAKWLFCRLSRRRFDGQRPRFDYTDLDTFLDRLMEIELYPVIEFMGDIFPMNATLADRYRSLWFELTDQLIKRYTRKSNKMHRPFQLPTLFRIRFGIAGRYGASTVAKWKYELWNEPDLRNYNILNFTFDRKLRRSIIILSPTSNRHSF